MDTVSVGGPIGIYRLKPGEYVEDIIVREGAYISKLTAVVSWHRWRVADMILVYAPDGPLLRSP